MSRESNKVFEDQSELFRAWDTVKRSDGVQHKGIEVDEIDGSSVGYPGRTSGSEVVQGR